MRIHFFGGADTVTGSKYLVESADTRVLLDCGLFQGYKTHRERNWAPLPLPAADIDAVVLSHAHLDHAGWLPVLVRHGFRGPVYASAATRDLAEVLLLDSARLQEAKHNFDLYRNRHPNGKRIREVEEYYEKIREMEWPVDPLGIRRTTSRR